MAKINYKGREIPLVINHRKSMLEFPDLGLDLHSIFEENNTVIQTIMLNDKVMVKIWYHYINESTGDEFDEALEQLTPEDMRRFREDFWTEVVNFMPFPARNALQDMWQQAKRSLKSQGKNSENLSSGLSDEQE